MMLFFKNAQALHRQNAALEKLERALQKMSEGDFNIEEELSGIDSLPFEEKEIFNRLSRYLLNIREANLCLVRDAESICDCTKYGELNFKLETQKYRGRYAEIGNLFSSAMAAISAPIKEADAKIQKLEKNDYSDVARHDYKGDFGALFDSIDNVQKRLMSAQNVAEKISRGDTGELENLKKIGKRSEQDHLIPAYIRMMETIRDLMGESARVSAAAAEGRLDVRGDAFKFQGCYADLINGLNGTLDATVIPLKAAGDAIGRMCVNDFTEEMPKQFKGQYLELTTLVNTLMGRLSGLQIALSSLAVGDTSRVEDYRRIGKRSENDKIMPATIAAMDAIRDIIGETERMTLEITNGNIKSTKGEAEKFSGGFQEIITGMNHMLKAVTDPLDETLQILSKMALNDFTEKMSDDYNGDFAMLADSINDVQKRLLSAQNVAEKIARGDTSELEGFRKIGRRSDNDHLVPAFTGMMETIRELIDETTRISAAAVEGRLDVRGDASKFQGEYIEIIEGINSTLDAVSEPVREVTDIMTKMSAGAVHVSMTGKYKGEYEVLTTAVNSLLGSLGFIINEIGQILSEMAKGNLNVNVSKDYRGDYAVISDSLKTIIRSLNQTLGSINTAAEQVSSGAAAVSQSSETLSQGCEEQASSIEEVTASVTELAEQVRENASNAGRASELSLAAKGNADVGNRQMEVMLQAMQDINEASSSISKIIKVIEDIASQTNILALNAAVEAARAGQYGKGFAVVAEEVRNLAAKSADAAKETTALIDSSITKVNSGSKTANETAKSLKEIVEGIAKAADLVDKIASASNEQASAIAQVNQAIEQVSRVIQTNSATAEESASASEELSGQSDALKQMVGRFKLKENANVKIDCLGIDPELLGEIERLLESRKTQKSGSEDGVVGKTLKAVKEKAPVPGGKKISLDDADFGKY